MATFMASLDKPNIAKIYFKCSYREQALRFMLREFGGEVYNIAAKELPVKEYSSLEAVVDDIKKLNVPNIESICKKFLENAKRDRTDKLRLKKVYGFDFKSEIDIHNIVLDVTGKTADQNYQKVLDKLRVQTSLKPIKLYN